MLISNVTCHLHVFNLLTQLFNVNIPKRQSWWCVENIFFTFEKTHQRQLLLLSDGNCILANLENNYQTVFPKLQDWWQCWGRRYKNFLSDTKIGNLSDYCRHSANRNGDGFLNIFSMNIRSLPKHGGELVNFISSMETKFEVIILTEIGARNLSVVLNLFPAYTFHNVRPQNNNYGGVGIYTHNSLLNVVMMEDLVFTKSCDCSKCEFESLFIEFVYNGILYTVGGIYRHPSGNVSHFISSLETILTKLDDRKNVILAGDMNIDLKYTNENVMSYMSTMMSYRYLPYVTLPTRITQFSTTCIDHIFVKKSHKEKVLSTLFGMFYCDISDHLPCFISLQHANNSYAGNRPMSRIFGARNCSKFVQKMTTENWNDKYMDSEHDWYHKFVTTVHQIFQQ